jgi:putative intracellular protease/amidase
MRILLILLAMVLSILSHNVHALTTQQQITATLNNYIQGSSFNFPDQLSKAFNPGAELFLDGRDDKLRVMKAEEYVALFAKNPPGQVNNRIGEILSIEAYGKTAIAKVEILMTKSERRFIDYFILKLINGEWKIASKAASAQASNLNGRRILMVLSNAHFHGDSDLSAGNSFSEIVDAYDTFKLAGFTIDFISPKGGAVPLGYINTSDNLQKHYLYHTDFMYALGHTKRPDEIITQNFEAVYYVGGSSTIYDVPQDTAIQKLVMKIYQQQGVVAAVCNGAAGLVNLVMPSGEYLVAGKNLTGYPHAYEAKDKAYYSHLPFSLQKTIEQHQGKFSVAKRGTVNAVVDGRLVTGQNRYSAKLVAQKTIDLLLIKGAG